jgi:hypothetical protein
MNEEALTYRANRGVLYRDEQMALLVQRVSGEASGDWYFPAASPQSKSERVRRPRQASAFLASDRIRCCGAVSAE